MRVASCNSVIFCTKPDRGNTRCDTNAVIWVNKFCNSLCNTSFDEGFKSDSVSLTEARSLHSPNIIIIYRSIHPFCDCVVATLLSASSLLSSP